MLIIKNNGKSATVKELASAVKLTGIIPLKDHDSIEQRLQWLQLGAERFGEVDLKNAQQVELVAYRITTIEGKLPDPEPEIREVDFYKLAIIGAGSTTAYYLDTLGPAYDHTYTIVIGEENPWIQQRGRGIPFINHTWRQIAFPSENVTKYGGNESFADRTEFGLAAEQRIRDLVGKHWIDASVRSISKDVKSYRISFGKGKGTSTEVRAEKVVFAAGSGAWRVPDEVRKKSIQNWERIIDMNTFVRDKAEQEKEQAGVVVVWGSNAAIDAVAAAKRHGWVIGGWLYSGDVAWLPGTRYRSDPYRLQDVQPHVYKDRKLIKIEDDKALLKVSDGDAPIATGVSYVVYGLGSEDLLSPSSKIMDPSVLEGEKALDAIVDEAGVFDDPRGGNKEKAFLGWKNKSGTFLVFGLAAENYEGQGRIALKDPRVTALKRWLSGDVLTVGQLTYIRSALRAFNNFIAGSIEHDVDFSHADANTLRVHLAARYPDLPETYARSFISMIRRVRLELTDRLPHGFTERQVAYFKHSLATKEQNVLAGKTNSGLDAAQWARSLERGLKARTPKVGQEVEDALKKINPKDM